MQDNQDILTYYAKNPPNNFIPEWVNCSYAETNRICGDDIAVHFRIDEDRIASWGFTGNASLITTACAALFGEWVIGKTLTEVLTLTRADLIRETGIEVTYRRRRAQVIALLATRNAIHTYLQDGKKDDFVDVGIDVSE